MTKTAANKLKSSKIQGKGKGKGTGKLNKRGPITKSSKAGL